MRTAKDLLNLLGNGLYANRNLTPKCIFIGRDEWLALQFEKSVDLPNSAIFGIPFLAVGKKSHFSISYKQVHLVEEVDL